MLTIGQLAKRTRMTARALRLYEQHGMLAPERTPAGRRVYGPDQVAMVMQIRTLKETGLTLAGIADLIKSRRFDAVALVDRRLAQVEAERARLSRVAASLRATRASLDTGLIDTAALATLLADPTAADLQMCVDRWFTPKEQEEWRGAASYLEGQDWQALLARVRAAMQAGTLPDSNAGRALGAECRAGMQPAMHAAGNERWNRGVAMMNEVSSGDGSTALVDVSAVYAWITAAVSTPHELPAHEHPPTPEEPPT